MNLEELKRLGAFAPAKPIRKTVTWRHPATEDGPAGEVSFEVWIRQLSAGLVDEILADQQAMTAEAKKQGKSPKELRRSIKAIVLSECLYLGENENALTLIPYQAAYQLRPGLSDLLWGLCNEVNDLELEDPKHPKG